VAVEKASEYLNEIDHFDVICQVEDIEDMSFSEGEFDLIISSETMRL